VSADHPWVPRATCDSSCVHADAAAGHSVVVAWRIAVRATFAVLLLSALPMLAIPLPGRSHIQRELAIRDYEEKGRSDTSRRC